MTTTLPQQWRARWIAPAQQFDRHPILFRNFHCNQPVRQATLYVSGLGLFEVYWNGKPVSDEVLAPFFDDYGETVQTLKLNVTHLICEENHLEIWLGDGWYKGRFGMIPRPERWGNEHSAIAQLEIEYVDGTQETVITDELWSCRLSSILSSGIYDGERQDHTLPCDEVYPTKVLDRGTEMLISRDSPKLMVIERLPVQHILQTPNGETVLDFGQNFAGWVEFEADLPVGTALQLDFCEVLVNGNFFNDNYRSANGGFSVVCGGGKVTYRPHFTYFGFRYVRLTGWNGPVDEGAFHGCVIHSNLPRTGWFRCGHAGINRLYENTFWSQRSNFVDIPTDCPQRDERLPWTGDAQVFCSTACYHMDSRQLYSHFLRLLRQDQLRRGGAVANYLLQDPVLSDSCAIWGDAAIVIPMTLYDRYGDREALTESYPMMRDWAEYLLRQDDAHGGRRLYDWGFQFGDWLALDGITESSFKGGTEDGLVATFYWYHAMALMARASDILGYAEDRTRYADLAAAIRAAALEEYFTPSGRLAIDTQTAYLLSLRFGIYHDKARVISGLCRRLEKDGYQLTSGFAAAPLICSTLAGNGLADQALRLLFREGYPGWLYEVGMGATTIWERWNSMLPDGTVNPAGMNSFNHFSYGSVAQFLYENVAGLEGTSPGFTSVRFAPCIDGRLGWCEAAYDSVSGRWESGWQIHEDGSVSVFLIVPDGCTAEIALPRSTKAPFTVRAGKFELTYQPTADYRTPYGESSLLCELAADPAAAEVLEKLAPATVQMGRFGDKEARNTALGQLRFLPFLGLSPVQVDELTDTNH